MKSLSPLRLRRIAKGITQGQLASAARVSQQLLSKIEVGRIQLSAEKAVAFAKILDCQPAELLPALALTPQPETESLQELELLTMFRTLDPVNRTTILRMARIMHDQDQPKCATAN